MTENNTPLVSVVLASYNGEKYITQQIESILKQTYSEIELIICDDCSTDNTQNIIRSFALKDNRVKVYLNNENVGLNKNFETGILKATGKYICISDQDDVWAENKIDLLLNCFSEADVVLAHSKSLAFSGEHDITKIKVKGHKIKMMSGSESCKLLLQNSISGHNMMFHNQIVSYITPIPQGIYYDWWIAMVATTVGKIKACELFLTYHRHHQSNLTQKNKKAARQTTQEWAERNRALNLFHDIPNLSSSSKSLIKSLLDEWNELEENKFSFKLFWLMMRNAKVLFYYKTKRFRFFSFVKMSFRLAQIT